MLMTEQRAEKIASQMTVILATLVGVAIETSLTIPFVVIVSEIARNVPVTVNLDAEVFYVLVILLLLFPLPYSVYISFQIKPKRMISPLNILMGAWAMDSIVGLVSEYQATASLQAPYIFVIYLLAFISYMVGITETAFAGWLVGLDDEGTSRKTFSVNLPASMVVKVVQSDAFVPHGLKVIENEPQVLVLERRYRTGERIVFGLARQIGNPNAETIVATVAFKEGTYYVKEDKDASNSRDTMIHDLEVRLREDYPSTTVKETGTTDYASARAHAVAESLTDSGLAVGRLILRDLSTYMKVAFALTFAGVALATIGAYFKVGAFDYGNVFVGLFAILVGELAYTAREEILKSRQKKAKWPPS